jgi:hypothetical protein
LNNALMYQAKDSLKHQGAASGTASPTSADRHPPPRVLGGEGVTEFVACEGHDVQSQQDGRADGVRVLGEEHRLLAVPPLPTESDQADHRDGAQQYRHDAGEQQPPAGPVEEPDQRVDVRHHHAAALREGQHAPAESDRPWTPVHPLQRPERVERQLLQHAVAGQVGHHPAYLVRGQPTGDAGEVGDESREGARTVHEMRQLDLVRRQAQVAGLFAVRGPQHGVGHAARTDQLRFLDARANRGSRLGRVDPFGDRRPQPGVGRAQRLAGRSTRKRLPNADPGFDDRHASTPYT